MNFATQTFRWLSKSHINVSSFSWTKRLSSHPDYPSLLSLTDTPDEFEVSYNIINAVDPLKIDSHLGYILYHTHNDEFVISSVKKLRNRQSLDYVSFTENSDGLVVILVKNNHQSFLPASIIRLLNSHVKLPVIFAVLVLVAVFGLLAGFTFTRTFYLVASTLESGLRLS
ncbi:MAG: hypothetical protein ABWZ25_13100 [Chitinophagaceae bacterium]